MARIDLGLSDEEFLRETPYSFGLLLRRAEFADFKLWRGTAQVACILANVHRDSKKKPDPFSELDFIPSHVIPASLKAKPKRYLDLTPLDQRKAIAGMFGHSVTKDGKIVPRKRKKEKRAVTK